MRNKGTQRKTNREKHPRFFYSDRILNEEEIIEVEEIIKER